MKVEDSLSRTKGGGLVGIDTPCVCVSYNFRFWNLVGGCSPANIGYLGAVDQKLVSD